MTRASSERLAACAGPTKTQRARPAIQKTIGPAVVQHEDDGARDDEPDEREEDDRAGAEPVVEATGDDRRDAGDEVGGDRRRCITSLVGELEGHGGDDRAEGEDAGEAVAVDGAREQEPEGRARLA